MTVREKMERKSQIGRTPNKVPSDRPGLNHGGERQPRGSCVGEGPLIEMKEKGFSKADKQEDFVTGT